MFAPNIALTGKTRYPDNKAVGAFAK